MYRYDEFDAQFVAERTKQFRSQVERRLAGRLSENEFRPLRLMNGLYLQLCLLYTSPSPRDATLPRMPSSA